MANKETALDGPLGGLFLMMIMTSIWVLLAEYYFDNFDFKVIGLIFGSILVYFIYSYLTLSRKKSLLPGIEESKDSRKEKLYWIVVALEGIGILAANIILTNTGKAEFFISCFVLTVGLHFIPLAKVFERKFYYYIGVWTIIVAVTGIILSLLSKYEYRLINAFVCTGCAVSTTLCGLKIIDDVNKILIKTPA